MTVCSCGCACHALYPCVCGVTVVVFRFGMGRSAAMAVVAMAALGWDIKAAAHHMKERRPEVTTTVLRHRSVQTVAALLKQRQDNR